MPLNRIPLKSYHYKPKGKRTIGRPKKRWREQLQLWRRNRSKGPILDVYEDDDDDDDDKFRLQCVFQYDFILMTHSILNLRMLNWFFRFHSWATVYFISPLVRYVLSKNSPWLDCHNKAWRRVQIMHNLTMRASYPCYVQMSAVVPFPFI